MSRNSTSWVWYKLTQNFMLCIFDIYIRVILGRFGPQWPFKEDSAGSESLFYTGKNQSPQTDPMTPELETDSL